MLIVILRAPQPYICGWDVVGLAMDYFEVSMILLETPREVTDSNYVIDFGDVA